MYHCSESQTMQFISFLHWQYWKQISPAVPPFITPNFYPFNRLDAVYTWLLHEEFRCICMNCHGKPCNFFHALLFHSLIQQKWQTQYLFVNKYELIKNYQIIIFSNLHVSMSAATFNVQKSKNISCLYNTTQQILLCCGLDGLNNCSPVQHLRGM